jgi:hypothetical protein
LGNPSYGLYYVHGRWYNPETGLWLSPDAKGEYTYGSGQDPVNYAWCAIHFGAGVEGQIIVDETQGWVLNYFEPLDNECVNAGRMVGRSIDTAVNSYLVAQGLVDLGIGGTGATLTVACELGSVGACTPAAVPMGGASLVWITKGAIETTVGGLPLWYTTNNPIQFAQNAGSSANPPGRWGRRLGTSGAEYEEKVRKNFKNPRDKNLYVDNGEREVAFDAWDSQKRTLIDAKESNGASNYDKILEPWANSSGMADDILTRARDQLKAGKLQGVDVAWYVSNASTAKTLQQFFALKGLNIKIVFFP